jgi:PTS system nitrogen regulatory IIA component
MDLTIKDAVFYFDVPEETIIAWIEKQALPAYRINDQFRINRERAFEWATANGIRISPECIGSTMPALNDELPSLTAAITAGGIHYGLEGTTKQDVLQSAVRVLPLPDTVDRSFLVHMLLAREAVGSTGVGEGIALPHPRNPIVLPIHYPLVSLSFLKNPIDFDAIDGKPVYVFFLLMSPTVRTHLHLLSRIAYVSQNPAVKSLLRTRASAQEILAAIETAENSLIARS